MKAHELIADFVKESKREDVSLIAVEIDEEGHENWWHIHGDEQVPEDVESLRLSIGEPHWFNKEAEYHGGFVIYKDGEDIAIVDGALKVPWGDLPLELKKQYSIREYVDSPLEEAHAEGDIELRTVDDEIVFGELEGKVAFKQSLTDEDGEYIRPSKDLKAVEITRGDGGGKEC